MFSRIFAKVFIITDTEAMVAHTINKESRKKRLLRKLSL